MADALSERSVLRTVDAALVGLDRVPTEARRVLVLAGLTELVCIHKELDGPEISDFMVAVWVRMSTAVLVLLEDRGFMP